MKIGIITIFDAYNYGSFLQAFAMQTMLEERGHTVYMIDVRTNFKSVIAQKYLSKSLTRSILKFRRFFTYRKDWKYLNIVPFSKCPHLDLALIGSDEVWNIENESFSHSSLYYGKSVNADRVIAYAPSLGYSSIKSYDNKRALCDSILKNISWFGVRDNFTKDFLLDIGVSEVHMVCDPTILLYDQWNKYERPYKNIQDPYLIYYSYKEETTFKEYIKRFARERGLKIISVGFDYKWCDEQIIASPFEFLSLIDNASYVVTSTFHGTLFSTMYHKKFIEVEPARKAVDYLNQLGISRIADINKSFEDFEIILDSDIGYNQIDRTFECMQKESMKLLTTDNNI